MAGRHHAASGEGPNAVSLYDVRFFHDDGSTGLPKTIAVNYHATNPKRRSVDLYNANDVPTTILIQPQDFLYKTIVSAAAQDADSSIENGRIRLTLPPHVEVTLEITLN
jgi:hypothetical protein